MSIFVGNTFVKTEDVIQKYRLIDTYDIDDDDSSLGEVVLKDDYDQRINQIEDDVKRIINLIEKNYDLSAALDELKILAEKLY